jgi:hypothetical protein
MAGDLLVFGNRKFKSWNVMSKLCGRKAKSPSLVSAMGLDETVTAEL